MTISPTAFGAKDFEIVKREVLYQGVFRYVRNQIKQRLFEGGWSETYSRDVIERYAGSAVLPYDPILDRVILIEQFRPGCLRDAKGPWTIEIPAGILKATDNPEKIAISEADEEAGCKILEIIPITDFYASPGGSDEYIWVYCGKVDATHVAGVHGLEHEHEDIRVHNLTYDEAIAKLYRGEIKTPPAIVALYWLQSNREKLRAMWR